NLMERGLVKIVGRAEVIGRPMLYGTTKKFLEVFGLAKLADLPKADELRSPASKPPTPKDETPLFEDGQASAEGEQESEQTAQQTSEDGDTAPASDIPASPVVPQELTAPVVLSDEDEWDEELDAEEGGLDGDEFDEGDDEEWTDGEADE
ncbi:MAG: hypothetical protein HN909_09080, partial [Phycisphaerales bacterium]|nr:hypothetical protein [Phycisphaerales bacterium]